MLLSEEGIHDGRSDEHEVIFSVIDEAVPLQEVVEYFLTVEVLADFGLADIEVFRSDACVCAHWLAQFYEGSVELVVLFETCVELSGGLIYEIQTVTDNVQVRS